MERQRPLVGLQYAVSIMVASRWPRLFDLADFIKRSTSVAVRYSRERSSLLGVRMGTVGKTVFGAWVALADIVLNGHAGCNHGASTSYFPGAGHMEPIRVVAM